MKKRIAKHIQALAAALVIACALAPGALAGRWVYDGSEALREGALYPYAQGDSECLIDAEGHIYADDGYSNISVVISDSGARRFVATRIEGEQLRCYLLDERGTPLTDGRCAYISLQYDALIFDNGDGLYGAYGWDGHTLIEPVYETLYPVGDGRFVALDGPSYEIQDGQATLLWPGQAAPRAITLGGGDVIDLGPFDGGVAMAQVAYRDGTLCGLIDAEGRWRAAPAYEGLYGVGDGVYSVWRGGLSGLIDSAGRPILPIEYEDIVCCPMDGSAAYYAAERDDMVTVFDAATREPLFEIQDVLYCWFDNVGGVLNVHDLDGEGTRVYAMDGSLVSRQEDDASTATVLTADRYFTCDYDSYEFALMDTDGQVLLSGVGSPWYISGEDGPCALTVYCSRVVASPYGYTMLDWRRGRYALYDLDGHEILPPKYDSISQICEGLYAVERGPWRGVVNAQGEWVLRRSAYESLMD